MWKVVLCMCMVCWGGLREASAGLEHSTATAMVVRNLKELMNMTFVTEVNTYIRSMSPLYKVTYAVVAVLTTRHAYPRALVEVTGNQFKLREEKLPLMLWQHPMATLVVILAVLFAIALPIAGLGWCCWQLAVKRTCPLHRPPYRNLVIVFTVLLVLFLLAVAGAYSSEQHVERNLELGMDTINKATAAVRSFFNATENFARGLLVDEFGAMMTVLIKVLEKLNFRRAMQQPGEFEPDELQPSELYLGELQPVVAVAALVRLVQRLELVQADLRRMRQLSRSLRRQAGDLNSGLSEIKPQLLRSLARCGRRECAALLDRYEAVQLETVLQYRQMPDVSDLLNNVTALLDNHIKEEFRVLRSNTSSTGTIAYLLGVLNSTRDQLHGLADQITWLAGNASEAIDKELGVITEGQELIDKYTERRRALSIGVVVALFLLTLVFAFGLLCGLGGNRYPCFARHGSRILFSGVVLIFVLGGAVTLVTVGYLVAGVAAERGLCDPLTEPRGNRLIGDLEIILNVEKSLYANYPGPHPINLTSILVQCHRNETIFEVFQLYRIIDLGNISAGIPDKNDVRVRLSPDYELSVPAPRVMQQLAISGLADFDFDRNLSALNCKRTSLALNSLEQQVHNTSQLLKRLPFKKEARDLLLVEAALHWLKGNVLSPMLRNFTELNRTSQRLRDQLHHSALKQGLLYLLSRTNSSNLFLDAHKSGLRSWWSMSILGHAKDLVISKLKSFMRDIVIAAQEKVGNCEPLSEIFNATRDNTCKKTIMPMNGYWMSLALCVVLFVPLMVYAVRLARLFGCYTAEWRSEEKIKGIPLSKLPSCSCVIAEQKPEQAE